VRCRAEEARARITRDLAAFERDLEQHWGLPAGTFGQGGIAHVSAPAHMAVWTRRGGAVMSVDADLAAALIRAVETMRQEAAASFLAAAHSALCAGPLGTSCQLDVQSYLFPSPAPEVAVDPRVEVLAAEEFWPDAEERIAGVERLCAIREGSQVAAFSFGRRALQVEEHWLYAVGVRTRPDHRRRGLGRAVVSAVLAQIAAEEGAALWNCDVTNEASLRLAQSVGFAEHLWALSWKVGASRERDSRPDSSLVEKGGGGP
jgi:GNAT superfamily N-acetyltransferase